jgi:MoxR-like ATPase
MAERDVAGSSAAPVVAPGCGPDDVIQLAGAVRRILDEVERMVVGKRDVAELLVVGLLAGGHVLLEDKPGVAKTLLARSLAAVTGLDFRRVQFTPDLLPADLTGSSIYNLAAGTFTFQPGPLFANLVLADEINRAPPKTQAALLEAMAEGQITVDGTTHVLEPPFCVVATQNPIEFEGTYPLPEAQLDRFLLRLHVGYPERDEEADMLLRRAVRGQEGIVLRAVIDRGGLLAQQRTVESVHLDPGLAAYIVDLVAATREHPALLLGASPRGGLAIMRAARGLAAVRGRGFVLPDDVKAVVVPALAHRVAVRPERWVRGVRPGDVIAEILDSIAVPTVDPGST